MRLIGHFSEAPQLVSWQRQPGYFNSSMPFPLATGPSREEAPQYLRKSNICACRALPQGSSEGESAPPEAVIREGGGELVRYPVPGIHNKLGVGASECPAAWSPCSCCLEEGPQMWLPFSSLLPVLSSQKTQSFLLPLL